MDNLARNAMLARQAGMSYGKWKAMQQTVMVEKKVIPDGCKECKCCGKVFKPNDPRVKYCSIACRSEVNDAARRERLREYRARKGASK